MLSESFYSRKIDYLRISVTDRCNLRCIYCMPPGGITQKPHEEVLTLEETARLVKIFANIGIRKIRLTGGEPLVRRGMVSLINSLAGIEGIEEVALTTNGTLLSLYARQLKRAGVKRLNISLDTLREDRFRKITGSDSLSKVLEGIEKAKEAGFYPLKLNTVVMKGINDDEVFDFINFALTEGLTLRFIEFMPITPLWREDYFISIQEIKEICRRKFRLDEIENRSAGPAQYFRVAGRGILGFIRTDLNNCMKCRRIRLTSTGELKICLYETDSFSLREPLRDGFTDDEISGLIKTRLGIKECVNYRDYAVSQSYMCSIGG